MRSDSFGQVATIHTFWFLMYGKAPVGPGCLVLECTAWEVSTSDTGTVDKCLYHSFVDLPRLHGNIIRRVGTSHLWLIAQANAAIRDGSTLTKPNPRG